MITMRFTTKQFNTALKRYAKSTDRNISEAVRTVAMQVFRWVIKDTPKDTGNAQSNWRIRKLGDDAFEITNNTPYIRLLEYGGYGGKGPRTKRGVPGWTKGYVSKQAPRGMLRRALARARVGLLKRLR